MATKVYAIAADKGPVGLGATGSRNALLPAILKPHDASNRYVANEYVANNVGRFLGVPMPPGALTKGAGGMAFASLDFNFTGEKLPPLDPTDCYAKLPDDITGLVMFDILIANPDRHTGNVWALLHEKPHEMMAFDHGHSLLGYDQGKGLDRLKDLKDRLGISGGTVTGQNRHCLIDHLKDNRFFDKWIGRIGTIPDHLIDGTCDDVRDKELMDFSECGAVKAFLKHRRDNFRSIVLANKNEFSGIEQWGLDL